MLQLVKKRGRQNISTEFPPATSRVVTESENDRRAIYMSSLRWSKCRFEKYLQFSQVTCWISGSFSSEE